MKKIITTAIIFTALFSFLLFGNNLPAVFINSFNKTIATKSPENNSKMTNVKTVNPSVFKATRDLGIIGVSKENPVDNPVDNLFHVKIDRELLPNEQFSLEFELFGLKDYSSIPLSINNGLATGGYLVKLENRWSLQELKIPSSELLKGDNIIRFSLPENASFSYKVKNIKIRALQNEASANEDDLVLNTNKEGCYYNNTAYIQGFIKNNQQAKILIDRQDITVHNGKFEYLAQKPENSSDNWTVKVEAILDNGERLIKEVHFNKPLNQDYYFEMPKEVFETTMMVLTDQSFALGLSGAELQGTDGALKNNATLSVTALRGADMVALAPDMINVTANFRGYRFLPHGTQFSKPVDLSMAYDTSKIPQGYTEKDIRTYYFDEKTNNWVALPLDTTDALNHTVKSTTTHFTDMINAIIQVPESPQTMGYTPTTMSGIKAANPMAGIVQIDPPGANSYGSANMSFPIKIPAGRRGMQPSLGISYNSGGGNGWLGLGWDLSVPSIGIETRWGVPHYDPDDESETYTMGGEQLYPVAHRAEWEPRVADKQFHPRVEGSFARIKRHGNSPKEYWWEVTDKGGTKYYYGGVDAVDDNAVLKDYKGNIAHWALTKVIDLHGNHVTYEYEVVNTGDETYPLRQIYLKKITYTGFGEEKGAYTVEFERDDLVLGQERKDKSFDARLAFKRYNSDLLKTIKVKYQDTLIRSYQLKYKEGAFAKTLLENISELDNNGDVFYMHDFEYYDEVEDESGIKPFKIVEETHITHVDGNGEYFVTNLDKPTALSGNRSKTVGGGMGLYVGVGANPTSLINSVGGSYNKTKTKGYGVGLLIDLNGDGLPDKLAKKKNGTIYYRPQKINEEGNAIYGDTTNIAGLNNFSYEESVTRSTGVQAVLGLGSDAVSGKVGYNQSSTETSAKVYFSDVNGDGLVDVVDNGTVLYNMLNEKGHPEFTPNSNNTDNPILEGTGVSSLLMQVTQETIDSIKNANPLHDVVRVWVAPYTGSISVDATIGLLEDVSEDRSLYNPDGIKAIIEFRGEEKWSKTISANDYSKYLVSGLNNLSVEKGDKIFFRLQSIEDGAYDKVEWNPVIKYKNYDIGLKDANQRPYFVFDAKEDFILSGKQEVTAPLDGSILCKGNFTKPLTTDSVTLMVVIKRENQLSLGYERTFVPEENFNGEITFPVEVKKNDILLFQIFAKTNVAWTKMEWKPFVYYTRSDDPEYPTVISSEGEYLVSFKPVTGKQMYNNEIVHTVEYTPSVTDTFKVSPYIEFNGVSSTTFPFNNDYNGKIQFSIKKQDSLLVSSELVIEENIVKNNPEFELILSDDTPLFIEYHTLDKMEGVSLKHAKATIISEELNDTVVAGFYSQLDPNLEKFGHLYQGWGQFTYNASLTGANNPIDENKLVPDKSIENPKQINPDDTNVDMTGDDVYDPKKSIFVMMFPSAEHNAFLGSEDKTFVMADTMSSSRLGEDKIPELGSAAGGGRAIVKESVSVNNSFSGGIDVNKIAKLPEGLGASVGGNFAFGHNKIKSEFMDMNGDRYPDVLDDTYIQYTSHLGGLTDSLEAYPNSGVKDAKFNSYGASLGGSYQKLVKQTGQGGKNKFNLSGNASIDGSKSFNETGYAWVDINGDGLPDRVDASGNVNINLGYSFADSEYFGQNWVRSGKGEGFGIGLGTNFSYINKWEGSIVAGVNVNGSNNNSTHSLQDMNADGLPEQIYVDDNKVMVALNTGTGFSDAVEWGTINKFNENNSINEGLNVAFTAGFVIPIITVKIMVNVNGNLSRGFNKEKVQISDIDGDGFPDYLQSDTEGEIKYKASTIARTNKLKTVHRPLGSEFTLDYKPIGNTTDLGYSVWALSKVETNDGHPGDGVDKMAMTFEYENGYHDRHERAFYGFATVKTKQLDTENENKVYRTTVSNYENRNYYKKGLLLSQYLMDKDKKKYTESENIIKLKDPLSNTFRDDDYDTDNGIAFPVLKEEKKYFYEGLDEAKKTTHSIYSYDQYGNPESFTDFGEPGTSDDDINSTVTYHYFADINLVSIPESVEITDNKGKLFRKRETVVNAGNGNIEQIKQYLSKGDPAVVDMEYDDYGNMTKITYPKNHNAERMYYEYQYDSIVNSFVTSINDAFGYSSTAQYDFKHGQVLKTTDLNGIDLEYTIDSKGRLTRVLGPNEKEKGLPFTIEFNYHPFANVAWAHTKHYDPAFPDDYMETAIFTDGIGRVLQTKKDGEVYNPDSKDDEEVMIVTGHVEYDAYGRAVKSWLPITETIGNPGLFNTGKDNITPTTQTYDVMDRALIVTLPDDSETKTQYDFANDINGDLQFHVKSTDANGISTESFTNIRGQQTSIKAAMDTWTSFVYDPLGQLLEVTDPIGAKTHSEYDMFGRRTLRNHPDAGISEYEYDLAGNMIYMATANLKPGGQRIAYKYEYNRLLEINYPDNKFNDVRYEYGEPGAEHYRAGRLVMQEDGTGAQEFFYGIMGEITEHRRTIVLPGEDIYTFHTKYQFDTWNRMTEMTYPDNEVVKFNYNTGGTLVGMYGEKDGFVYSYITHQGYDKFGRPIHIAYGNGTESNYQYDPKRQWLTNLATKTELGRNILDNAFSYDKVGNILGIKNNSPIPGTSSLMGGTSDYGYEYDDLYRLKHAEGSWTGTNHEHRFSLDMEYNKAGDILRKNQLHQFKGYDDEEWAPRHKTTHDFAYKYESKQPHTLTNIYNSVGPNKGGKTYSYDANGNTLGYTDDQNANERKMLWDEENRLMALADNGKVHHYIYDAGGQRTIKAKGDHQLVNINGINTGGTGSADNYTMYVFPHFTVHNSKYTKHFFVGSQRILSKLGQPGTIDDIAIIEKINGKKHIDWDIKQNNTNEHIQGHIKWVGDDGTIMTAGKSGKIPPGILKKYSTLPEDSIEDNGNTEKYERNQYFFHPDHLGNTSFVTDASGEVSQHVEYLPFGEIMVDDRPVNDKNPYLYNGKELDEETGLYYYGARMYDAQLGRWHCLDPMEQFASGYVYAGNNPVNMIDPSGMFSYYLNGEYIGERGGGEENKPPDDITVDKASGKVISREKNDKPHRLFVQDGDSNVSEFVFNDSENDRKKLDNVKKGDKVLTTLSEKKLDAIMKELGIEKKSLLARNLFALFESSMGKLDFSATYIWPQQGMQFDPGDPALEDKQGYFYSFGKLNVAYNQMDAGNFMWGYAMKKLGFSLFRTVEGATKHHIISVTRSRLLGIGNLGLMDSAADTKAYMMGHKYKAVAKSKGLSE